MSHSKTAVIGAGPAGLTTAYLVSKSNLPVTVYESAPNVGGLSRSFNLWGQIVDVGPHRFFSNDKRVNRLWKEVVGNDYCTIDRLTRIYYNEKYFHYPLKPLDAIIRLGPITAIECLLSYLFQKSKFENKSLDTFSDWVIDRFGEKLYTIFFKTYSEKLWGISCDKLDSDFAAQRIKNFSLGEAFLSALNLSKIKHKTLIDAFAYPVNGTGSLYEKMADCIRSAGNDVKVESPTKKVVVENERCIGIIDSKNEFIPYDHVVSTMPLTLLVKGLEGLPDHVRIAAETLRFRNTIIVYLEIDHSDLFQDQWLYIHDSRVRLGRITNFQNWSKEITKGKSKTILALEYWCFENDEIWKASDESLIELAKSEVAKIGLNKNHPINKGFVLRINRSYPVYETGYKEKIETIKQHLSSISNLTAIGRYGSFKYNNQDHSILMGILTAENIVDGKTHNLWSVNTDYDEYQESSAMKKTDPNPKS